MAAATAGAARLGAPLAVTAGGPLSHSGRGPIIMTMTGIDGQSWSRVSLTRTRDPARRRHGPVTARGPGRRPGGPGAQPGRGEARRLSHRAIDRDAGQ